MTLIEILRRAKRALEVNNAHLTLEIGNNLDSGEWTKDCQAYKICSKELEADKQAVLEIARLIGPED